MQVLKLKAFTLTLVSSWKLMEEYGRLRNRRTFEVLKDTLNDIIIISSSAYVMKECPLGVKD